MTATEIAPTIDNVGNVPDTYHHEWRVATAQSPLILPNAIFKWYHVHRDGASIPGAMDDEARAVVTAAMAAGDWDPSYGLNFAVLHLSTAHAFLIPGVWRGHQELWARHYVKDLAMSTGFGRINVSGQDAPLACVWELGVICHERQAWSRFLFSDRSEAAKREWQEDACTGRV